MQQALHEISKNDYKPSSYEKLAAQFENWVTINLKGLPSVDGGQDMIVYLQEQTIEEKTASQVFVEVYDLQGDLADVSDSRWHTDNKNIYIHNFEDEEGFSYKAEISNGDKIIATYAGTLKEPVSNDSNDPTTEPANPNRHALPSGFVAKTETMRAEYKTRFGFAVKTDDGYDEDSVVLMPFDNIILSYKIGKQEIVRDLRTKSSDSLFEYDDKGIALKLTKLPERFEGHISFVKDSEVVGRAALTDKVIDVDLSSLVV